MDTLVFDSPTGSVVYYPVLTEILDLVRDKGEEYWNSLADSGFASLHYFRDKEEVASLVFSKKDGYGFHLKFIEEPTSRKRRKEYLSVGGDNYEDVAVLHLSGNPLRLPRALFVTDDQMEQTLRTFFQGGTRGTHEFWVPLCDIKWDLGAGQPLHPKQERSSDEARKGSGKSEGSGPDPN